MIYSHEVEKMCTVAQGVNHGAAPIPEEAPVTSILFPVKSNRNISLLLKTVHL